MTLVLRTFCLLHAVFVGAVFAEESPLLREARRALAESIPHVAIAKIERLFASGNLPGAEENAARLLLGEAFLQARRFDDAHAAIAPLAARNHRDARLLQADIFAAAGEWARALPLYHAINNEPEPPVSALLGEAESLHALGQTPRAMQKLQAAIVAAPQLVAARLRLASFQVEGGQDKRARRTLAGVHPTERGDMKWKEYVEARQLLLADQPAPALVMFEEIVKEPRGLSEGLLVGATFGIVDARSSMHGSDAADSVLESFIWKNPGSPYLELVFRRLDQIYATQENPSENELQKWTKNAPPRCAALAWYYLARLQLARRQPEKAAQTLQEFITRNATHPLVPHAHLMEADLFIANGLLANAITALEAAARRSTDETLRAEIELRTGIAHFHAGEFLLAGSFFDLAARRSRKLRELALYNSALAALRLNNLDRFFEQYRELRRDYPGTELHAELELEQGLAQARTGDARAAETLELFLHHFPEHARSSEARIALAELAFAGRDLPVAAQYLRVASTAGNPANTADHADYLALFLADAETPRDEQRIINLAKEFIRNRPQSSLLPEVRLKLGQVYFRNNDFPNAETQLVVLAREHSQSAYAEPALFLAGQAAMKTGAVERALELFDQVAGRNGPLKLRAREQQAIIASGQGKAREAIALYEIILTAQPPPEPELRYAALCGKADNLIAIATKEPGQIDPALAIYDALAASDAGLVWRNQALYKKGKALEQRGLKGEALSAYYDVLNQSEGDEREYFWFYKAGFDAARIFESQEQWQSALGIYKKMARQKGPRATEVNERVRELRLARFLWD